MDTTTERHPRIAAAIQSRRAADTLYEAMPWEDRETCDCCGQALPASTLDGYPAWSKAQAELSLVARDLVVDGICSAAEAAFHCGQWPQSVELAARHEIERRQRATATLPATSRYELRWRETNRGLFEQTITDLAYHAPEIEQIGNHWSDGDSSIACRYAGDETMLAEVLEACASWPTVYDLRKVP